MKNVFTRKKVAVAISIISIMALLLSSTWAFIDFTQHKTNPMQGEQQNSVTLLDEFTTPEDWKTTDGPVKKEISVKNLSTSVDPMFVRVQLKEYFELAEFEPVKDSTDTIILFATHADGPKKGEYITWAEKLAEYPDYDYDYCYVEKDTIGGKEYAITKSAEERDGIYGKPMYVLGDVKVFFDSDQGGAPTKSDKPGEPHKIQYPDHPECKYNIHKWGETITDECPECEIKKDGDMSKENIHEYIKWNLGYDVKTMQEWIDSGAELGEFWIVDIDGWAYWANPLFPGTSTAMIMQSLELLKNPGRFEYQIHVDMEALTLEDMDKWTNTSAEAGHIIHRFKNADLEVKVKKLDDLLGPAGAVRSINENGTILLTEGIDTSDKITIDGPDVKNLTIIGDGNEINSSNSRSFAIEGLEDAKIRLSNININSTSTAGLARGISVWGNTNLELIIEDSVIDIVNYYALNVTDNNTGLKLTVRNSKISGWAAVNFLASNAEVVFENCTLIGFSDNKPAGNAFAAIVIARDGAVSAKNNKVTFNNCKVEATTDGTAEEFILSIQATTANNALNFTNCEFDYSQGTAFFGLSNTASGNVVIVDGKDVSDKPDSTSP